MLLTCYPPSIKVETSKGPRLFFLSLAEPEGRSVQKKRRDRKNQKADEASKLSAAGRAGRGRRGRISSAPPPCRRSGGADKKRTGQAG